jgi:hypothetical protein
MDDPKTPEHWVILFRSDDPGLWNTDAQDFALPLKKAPATIAFVRLRRMDTGDTQIVRLTRRQLGIAEVPNERRTYWWNGSAKQERGACHLGILHNQRYKFPAPAGLICLLEDRWDCFLGSGFGHKTFVNELAGQCYSWKNREIKRTIFEIAVTKDPLTAAEQRCLED